MSKVVPLLETLFMNKGGSPELWRAIIKVINSIPEEAKYFALYVKTKIKHLNKETQILALDLTDYVVDEGKFPVWTQISSKDFLKGLIGLLKTRDIPEVQIKILYLIKKWGLKFEKDKEILPNFLEIYKSLKSTGGIIFPDNYQSDYYKYLGEEQPSDLSNKNKSPIQKQKESLLNNYNEDFGGFSQNQNSKRNFGIVEDYEDNSKSNNKSHKNYKIDLNHESYDKKYSKLISKLSVWFENVILANDMIDNTKIGDPIEDGLKFVIDNLRNAENDLIIYIQEKVRNEKVLELCLGINDDINKTITRYDVIRSKSKPESFFSHFEILSPENFHKKSKNNRYEESSSISKSLDKKLNIAKQSNDAFDVFNMKKEIDETSIINKPSSNLKSVDDIFEIFGGNMSVNSGANFNPIKKEEIANSDNRGSNNFDFNSFSKFQNNIGINQTSVNEPVFNLVNVNNNKKLNTQNVTNINNNNSNPGIESLTEKLKNIYSAKDENENQKRLSPNVNNMGTGMNNNMFSFPGQSQYPNFNNPMTSYNMMVPGIMGYNVQSNIPNVGMNPNIPLNQNNPQFNQMNQQQNRGYDPNFQNNTTANFDPFNF